MLYNSWEVVCIFFHFCIIFDQFRNLTNSITHHDCLITSSSFLLYFFFNIIRNMRRGTKRSGKGRWMKSLNNKFETKLKRIKQKKCKKNYSHINWRLCQCFLNFFGLRDTNRHMYDLVTRQSSKMFYFNSILFHKAKFQISKNQENF